MPTSTLAVIGAVLVVACILWAAWSDRRSANAPALTLLRCLFPAWRFYEAVDPHAQLSYRLWQTETNSWSGWRDALRYTPRAWPLPLNAAGNLHLAYQSLVERFESDLEDEPVGPATELVSYRLVQALVLERLAADGCGTPRYQFQLHLPDAADAPLFVSAELTVAA